MTPVAPTSTSQASLLMIAACPQSGLDDLAQEIADAIADVEVRVCTEQAVLIEECARCQPAAVIVHQDIDDSGGIQTLERLREANPRDHRFVVVFDDGEHPARPRLAEYDGIEYIRPDSGEFQPLIVVIARLIERARVEERLHSSQTLFSKLVENSNDGVYVLEGERFVYANQRFEEMCGFTSSELSRPNFSFFTHMIDEESVPELKKRRERLEAGLKVPPRYEFAARKKDGTRFYAQVSVTYVEFDGRPASLGIMQDVTQQKRYERDLLRKNRELQLLHDLAGSINQTVNLDDLLRVACTRLHDLLSVDATGISLLSSDGRRIELRASEGLSDDVQRSLASVDGASDALLAEAINTGEVQVVSDLQTDDRVVVPAVRSSSFKRAFVVPMTAGDARVGVAFAFISSEKHLDDDDRFLMERIGLLLGAGVEKSMLLGKLVESEKMRALGELAAGVAHDFNNVLGAILGRVQLMQRQMRDPGALKHVDVIHRAATDGAETVRRVQELGRGESRDDFVPVCLSTIIDDVVELTRPRWSQISDRQRTAIEVSIERRDPEWVNGNPHELREVLINLVNNAVDAMPNGGTLVLTTRTEADDAEQTELIVKDDGPGIIADVRARIFDPFFTTKGEHGTGLGLSVSASIIRRHGGQLVCDSSPEEGRRGTEFRIALPRTVAPELPTTEESGLPVISSEDAGRILVIDDEENIREILTEMLISADFVVETAEDGKDGIAKLSTFAPDLVFTDLALRGMTGYDVARAVRRIAPGVPVGLVTGWGGSLEDQEAAQDAFDLILSKPFRLDDVLRSARDAISRRRTATLADR